MEVIIYVMKSVLAAVLSEKVGVCGGREGGGLLEQSCLGQGEE